jgi:protein-disulfide isomerase
MISQLLAQAERRPGLSLAVVIAAALALSWFLQTRPPPDRELRLTQVVETTLRDRGSPRVGAENADVTVVVFTDYRCAICRRTDPALEQIVASDPGTQVIYKDWPILGESSRAGARIALAAHRQGKYPQMHRLLMTTRAAVSMEMAAELATQAGVDAEALQMTLATDLAAIDAQLDRHAAQAFALGLQGTPAYLVGPYLVQGGLDEGKLGRLVAKARKAGPPKSPEPAEAAP